jgi:hypothetical protein
MNSSTTGPSRSRAARLIQRAGRAGAFTVVEMIIAVGALAILSVGVAQIFRATGETVKVGRRISNINNYAAMIERQMRKDFEAMTRDGFLVIRNEITGGDPALSPDEPATQRRNRHIDEILFFATGDFASLRDPVHPDRVVRSPQARIYFGHGLSQDPKDPNYYNEVHLDDTNSDPMITPAFGLPSAHGGRGPNQYAMDWTLLRYVSLLATPNATTRDRLSTPVGSPPEPTVSEEPDNDIQVRLQPAVSSVFQNNARYKPNLLPPDSALVRDETPVHPRCTCGVVDIITSDLGEIRSTTLDAQDTSITRPFSLDQDYFQDGAHGAVFQFDTNPALPNSSTRRMQAWMRQAFPAPSDTVSNTPGARIRCEPSPPDLLGVRGSGGLPYNREYKRTDQNMLSSFNFVPHCTEFIVEYSFGKVYPPTHIRAGQLIWHGMNTPERPDVRPYRDPANNGWDIYNMPYRNANGSQGTWQVKLDTIRIPTAPFGGGRPPEYSYFGYVDPSYRPVNAGDPETIAWAWPKLIRVTISLVDPTDPLTEQTYQFIFTTPGNPEDHAG